MSFVNIQSTKSSRPPIGSKTARVWEIADRLSREAGRCATRKEVLDALAAEAGNANTGSTQYHLWKQDYERRSKKQTRRKPGSSGKVTLQMGAEGRILIPAELRSLMLVGEDGKVMARVKDGELRVTSPRVALLRLQRMIKDRDRGTDSVVDELLAERKVEMRRE